MNLTNTIIIRIIAAIFMIFSFKKVNSSVEDKKNRIAIQQIIGFLVAMILIIIN